MRCHVLSFLRIADLPDEHRINAVRVLLEATQFRAIIDRSSEALDMLAQDRLRVVLTQQPPIGLARRRQPGYAEHFTTMHDELLT